MRRILQAITIAACLVTGCSKADMSPAKEANEQEAYPSAAPIPSLLEYSAIVTVKQDDAARIFFQLDNDTRLYPDNYPDSFTRQCRIICGLSWYEGSDQCTLHWMDYLQEGAVQSQSAPEGDEIDILEDWMTSVEDGYLTLHYSTFWGDGSLPHTLFLVAGENPEDPYELRLVHLRGEDPALTQADALIYFDLAGLPPTGGGGRALTLKWKNGAGQMVSQKYLFRSRQ